MGDLLKEAIADAKAVRETALQNAKMALEEAFTPQIKSMLSAKLKEDEFEDEEDVVATPDEEEYGDEEEVPAEEGTYEDEEFGGGEEVPDEEEFGGEEEPEVGDEEEEVPEEGVIEINGVKYAPVVAEEEVEEDLDIDNLDLESVIKELESEISEGEDGEDTVDESDDSSEDTVEEAASDDDTVDESTSDEDKVDEEIEIDENILEGDDDETVDESDNEENDSIKTELNQYKEAVQFLQSKLHEVNILNAKLLYTNKLFREYVLDNNQKLKVVETFDRAQTTREIKLVYSTLAEQFGDNGSIGKKSIKESASAKVGSTKPSKESKKVISEENQVANRFKKLAGLIK